MKNDVLIEPGVEDDEPAARFRARRLLRWVAILTIGILVTLSIWQAPLYAELH